MKTLFVILCVISALRHVRTARLSDLSAAILWRIEDLTGDTCNLIVTNRDLEQRMRLSEPGYYQACKNQLLYPDLEALLLFVTRQCLPKTLSTLYDFHGLSSDSDACVDLLMEAVGADCKSIVDFLIDGGADVNADVDVMSAAEVAISRNNVPMFDHLVSRGAVVDVSEALCGAVESDHLSMLRHIIEIATAENVQVDFEPVFTVAGSRGNVDILRYLAGIPVPLKVDFLNGAVSSAGAEGKLDAVLFLCGLGASKKLALSAAALNGHTELLAKAIHLPTQPEEKLSSTILNNAVVSSHYDSVKLLAPHFDADTRAEALFKTFGALENHEDPEIFCFLLNSPGILYETYLRAYVTAARWGKRKILELFLSEEARSACLQRNKYNGHFITFENLDVDLRDGAAILIAYEHSHYETVKYLIEMGSSYLEVGLKAAVEAYDIDYAKVLADRVNNPAFLEQYFQVQVLHGLIVTAVACMSLEVRYDITTTIMNAIASRNEHMFRLFENDVQEGMIPTYACAAFETGNLYVAQWLSEQRNFVERELQHFLSLAIANGKVKTIALALDLKAPIGIAYTSLLSQHDMRGVSLLLTAIGRSKLTGDDCFDATIKAFQAVQVPENYFLRLLPSFERCRMRPQFQHFIAGHFAYFGFIQLQAQNQEVDIVAAGCYRGVLESIGRHLPYTKALVRAGCSVKQLIRVETMGSIHDNMPLKHAMLLYALSGQSLEPVKWALSPEVGAYIRFGPDIAIKAACRINSIDGFKFLLSEGKYTLEELNEMKILDSAVKGGSLEIVRILLVMGVSTDYQHFLPLRYAVSTGNLDLISALVGAKDAGEKLGLIGERLLGGALISRSFELAKIVLDGGIMPTTKNFNYCIETNLMDFYCFMVTYKKSMYPRLDDACLKQDGDMWKQEAKVSRRSQKT